MANKIEVYFSIAARDFDPSEITNALGVEPTSSHATGEPLKYVAKAKYSKWCLSSGVKSAEDADMYELSRDLIDILKDKIEVIISLKNKFDAKIVLQTSIQMDESEEPDNVSYPSVGLESDEILFLSKIGASLDVDIN